MEHPNEIRTREKFDEEVLGANATVIAMFFKSGCAPCAILGRHAAVLTKHFGERIKFFSVNIAEDMRLLNVARSMGVEYSPTVMVIENGNKIKGKEFVGNYPIKLKALFEEYADA